MHAAGRFEERGEDGYGRGGGSKPVLGARNYLKKPGKKNIRAGPDSRALLGTKPSTVSLSQYHTILQAVLCINNNDRTDICLNAFAGAASISPSHVSRIFKKAPGVPYQDSLNDRRITKVKNILRTSNRSVTEIAVVLVFADPTGPR